MVAIIEGLFIDQSIYLSRPSQTESCVPAVKKITQNKATETTEPSSTLTNVIPPKKEENAMKNKSRTKNRIEE
jgi:hypothetical protein